VTICEVCSRRSCEQTKHNASNAQRRTAIVDTSQSTVKGCRSFAARLNAPRQRGTRSATHSTTRTNTSSASDDGSVSNGDDHRARTATTDGERRRDRQRRKRTNLRALHCAGRPRRPGRARVVAPLPHKHTQHTSQCPRDVYGVGAGQYGDVGSHRVRYGGRPLEAPESYAQRVE